MSFDFISHFSNCLLANSQQKEDFIFESRRVGRGLPTYDEEDGKANDEEGGATDSHSTSKFDKGRKQQGGPKHEVEQRPRPTRWDYCGPGEFAVLVVDFL